MGLNDHRALRTGHFLEFLQDILGGLLGYLVGGPAVGLFLPGFGPVFLRPGADFTPDRRGENAAVA